MLCIYRRIARGLALSTKQMHKIIELVLKLYIHVYKASTFTRSYVVYANYVVSCHCLYVHLYLHAEVDLVEHLININVSISTEGKSIS